MLKFKSVYDPIKPSDGIRILATRYRGRGMKKNRYTVWMPNLGPSTKLLKSDIGWGDFKNAYKKELLSSASIDSKNDINRNRGQKFTLRLLKKISKKNTITLMCHCATDAEQCHLRVLEKILKHL